MTKEFSLKLKHLLAVYNKHLRKNHNLTKILTSRPVKNPHSSFIHPTILPIYNLCKTFDSFAAKEILESILFQIFECSNEELPKSETFMPKNE